EGELLAWLRRILVNHLANVARHFQACGRDREGALNHGDSSLPLGDRVADSGGSPSAHAMAREADDGLRRALEKLPDDYRQVVWLRQWENLPFDEIGKRMDRSGEAARQLWRRAIELLAEFLEQPHGSSSHRRPASTL